MARRADALVVLAEHAVATADDDGRGDARYLATVILTPDALDPGRDSGGCCTVAAGDGTAGDVEVAVPTTTAARMLCDAVVEGPLCDESGDPLRLGRRHRVVSRRLRRALWFRDGGCRFPGCTHRGWLDAHHIVHWLELGATEPETWCCCAELTTVVSTERVGRSTVIPVAGSRSVPRRARPSRAARRSSPVTPPPSKPTTAARRRAMPMGGDRLDLEEVITIVLSNQDARRRRAA